MGDVFFVVLIDYFVVEFVQCGLMFLVEISEFSEVGMWKKNNIYVWYWK